MSYDYDGVEEALRATIEERNAEIAALTEERDKAIAARLETAKDYVELVKLWEAMIEQKSSRLAAAEKVIEAARPVDKEHHWIDGDPCYPLLNRALAEYDSSGGKT